MAVTGTPTSGNDTLTGDAADDQISGQEGDDSIDGGGGDDVIHGDEQLVSNGTLDSTQNDNSWSLGTVTGWFNSGSGGLIERWGNGFLGLSTADGSSFIELDANRGGALDHVQTNVELDTGVEYTLTFDAAARAGSSVNDDFEVTHNGVVIATISPTSTGDFTTFSVTLTGLTGTDTIGFREIAGQNNSLGILLDNVQISLTEDEVSNSSFTYNDVLNGDAGNDSIYGQEGDDTITGGTGNDYMEGGIGSDIFVLEDGSGSDVIGDFTIGEDLLDVTNLTDSAGNPVDFADVVVTSDGEGGSILTFPNGEQVRLRDIPPSALDTEDELTDIGIPCFVAGTMLTIETGEIAVEHLQSGDIVITLDRDSQHRSSSAVCRVFKRTISSADLDADPKLRPVRILAGALGEGLPKRDLLVSRQHRMLVQSKIAKRMFGETDVLIPAIKLTELPGIYIDETVTEVTYFHILFDQHEVIFAEGSPTESLYTGPEALKAIGTEAREEIFRIFPEIAVIDFRPEPARLIPTGKKQKQLVARHCKNRQPLLQPVSFDL